MRFYNPMEHANKETAPPGPNEAFSTSGRNYKRFGAVMGTLSMINNAPFAHL